MMTAMLVQAAQAVGQSAAVAIEKSVNEPMMPTVTAGVLIYFLQKWFKTMPFYQSVCRAIPGAAKWGHRLFAVVASIVAVLGVHWTITGDATSGWQFAATIPSFASLLHSGLDGVQTFLTQQVIYETSTSRGPTNP